MLAMWYTSICMHGNNLGRILWLWQRLCSSLEWWTGEEGGGWAASTAKFHQQMQMKWQFAACSHSYGQNNSNDPLLNYSIFKLNVGVIPFKLLTGFVCRSRYKWVFKLAFFKYVYSDDNKVERISIILRTFQCVCFFLGRGWKVVTSIRRHTHAHNVQYSSCAKRHSKKTKGNGKSCWLGQYAWNCLKMCVFFFWLCPSNDLHTSSCELSHILDIPSWLE